MDESTQAEIDGLKHTTYSLKRLYAEQINENAEMEKTITARDNRITELNAELQSAKGQVQRMQSDRNSQE